VSSATRVAEGEQGNKSFSLVHVYDGFDDCYVAKLREHAGNKSKVYYAAYGDIFEAVRNCAAWLDETPIEDRPTIDPPEPRA
jgi:hypothetical protein